ncbi:MAG: hypothetical protein C5B51_01925 [Terriglobia bacterium]|nr:MAG: hypothetical protein C5B51_01925 [Terriglobia bacterium]
MAASLAPFRRITSSGKFIPEIDGFRFAAIFFVFIYHLAEDIELHSSAPQVAALHGNWLVALTSILNIGVPLFFVISGFILGVPFAETHLNAGRRVSLKKYFLRRVTRLEPPYILCLLLFLIAKVASSRGTLAGYLPHFLASLFYSHNIRYGTFSSINVVAWSLEVEIQFYILAPLLAMMFCLRPAALRRLTISGLIIGATWFSQVVKDEPRLAFSILGYSQYFLSGLLFAELYVTSAQRYLHRWAWDLVSLVGWPGLLTALAFMPRFSVWIAPWLILLLYQAGLRGRIFTSFFANPIVATVGGMCYSIYLLHNYLIYLLGLKTEWVSAGLGFEERLLIQFLLMGPVVLIVSALYFRFVERPCMRPDWPERASRKFRAILAGSGRAAETESGYERVHHVSPGSVAAAERIPD